MNESRWYVRTLQGLKAVYVIGWPSVMSVCELEWWSGRWYIFCIIYIYYCLDTLITLLMSRMLTTNKYVTKVCIPLYYYLSKYLSYYYDYFTISGWLNCNQRQNIQKCNFFTFIYLFYIYKGGWYFDHGNLIRAKWVKNKRHFQTYSRLLTSLIQHCIYSFKFWIMYYLLLLIMYELGIIN